jgi:hypothetical protein
MNIEAGRAVLAQVAREFGQVLDSLKPIQAHFAAIARSPGPVVRESLAVLQPKISALLNRHRRLVVGAGVVTAPGLLADAEHWLEWWWSPASGDHVRLRVNLDPDSPDFFDCATADWYAVPRRTGAPYVAGPHVDYACTNEYATTMALPVTAGGAFVGVAAADVPVARIEEVVLPHLVALSPSSVLVNASGRVVASASPDYAPGLLATAATSIALPDGEGPALDWRLLDLAG